MYVVNQERTKVFDCQKFEMRLEYDDETKKGLEKVEADMLKKHYRSVSEQNVAIVKAKMAYIQDKIPFGCIYVNDVCFGVYTMIDAKNIVNCYCEALKQGDTIFILKGESWTI